MLSLAHRFIFIHIPKTAGNSIQRALLPYSEDKMALIAPHQDGIDRFEIRSPNVDIQKHSVLRDYKAQLPAEVYGPLFKFACVRNPWDRCVSHFFSPHRGKVTWSADAFGKFIENEVLPAEHYLQLSEDSPPFAGMDAIIRFETLADDLCRVCRQIGIGTIDLPRANASDHAGYREYYADPSLRELVASRFHREIDHFGYAF